MGQWDHSFQMTITPPECLWQIRSSVRNHPHGKIMPVTTAIVKTIINHQHLSPTFTYSALGSQEILFACFSSSANAACGWTSTGTSGKSKRVCPLLISHRPTWNMISVVPARPLRFAIKWQICLQALSDCAKEVSLHNGKKSISQCKTTTTSCTMMDFREITLVCAVCRLVSESLSSS